jgi:heptosyltransferase I
MRIAIIKLSALGDIVHAMVALQFIKAHLPDAEIHWIVEEQFTGILANNPDISQILTVNIKALKKDKLRSFNQIKKIRQYAKYQYDLVIDAQGLLKSAIVASLLGSKIAGFDKNSIRERLAACFYTTKVACPYDKNTIDRNVQVLTEPLGFSVSPEQIRAKQAFLFANNPHPELDEFFMYNRKTILFVIGSTWESRNYPPDKFVVIAQKLQQNCLVVWGNTEEKIKADWMAQQCDNIKVLPKLDFDGLKVALVKSDLVIGNDTGPTHMAWGLNKPSITIFGPTPVSRVYQTNINKVVKSASVVNPFQLNKQDYSIRDINPQEIIDQAEDLLI